MIEQAKGMLAQLAGLDMEESFARLRRHARSHNLRLVDVARSLIEGEVDPSAIDPLPPTPPS